MEKYYVAGCVYNGLGVDLVEDSVAEFWTLYAREASGESEALADFADRRSAEAAMAVYVERDALYEQVRALAAENAGLKSAFYPEDVPDDLLDKFGDAAKMDGDTVWDGDNCKSFSWVSNAEDLIKLSLAEMGNIETPATDAILREVGARAVEGYGNTTVAIGNDEKDEGIVYAGKQALLYAASIRAGEVPDV